MSGILKLVEDIGGVRYVGNFMLNYTPRSIRSSIRPEPDSASPSHCASSSRRVACMACLAHSIGISRTAADQTAADQTATSTGPEG